MTDEPTTEQSTEQSEQPTAKPAKQQADKPAAECPICPGRQLNADGFCPRCGYQAR